MLPAEIGTDAAVVGIVDSIRRSADSEPRP
jgi:hypothetical protein